MTLVPCDDSTTAEDADPPSVPAAARGAGGNLPAELSSFVGRQRELREVKRMMATARLVTLTGVGGVGKTRLAQRVATEIRRAFPGGTWFVGLAEIFDMPAEQPDPDRLAQLVGAALGLRDQAATRSVDALCAHFAGRRLLLVLDNCEHLSGPVAVLMSALLRRCPELRMIATSREPLAVSGEMVFPVPTMPTPDPSAPHHRRQNGGQPLDGYESVALFLARGATALPGFQLSTDNGPAIAGICRRLDGLPLAIELAAAWLPVLAPRQILERLDDRFALLSRGNRGAPDRQQTLRASIDWSYHLCTPAERRLWARLSIFAGAFELDAVEGICADDELPAEEMLDLVTGLLDKSVLIRDGWGPVARYRMLESLRAYAQQRLREQGDDGWLRHRYGGWYEQLVAQAHAEWVTSCQSSWLSRLEREHTNIRAAVELSLAEPDGADRALRIAVSLPPLYWAGRGLIPETRDCLARALRQSTAQAEDRLLALTAATVLAALQDDRVAALALVREAGELAGRIGTECAHALHDHAAGAQALYGDAPAVAVVRYLEALAGFRAVGDVQMQLRTLGPLSAACGAIGDTMLAASCAEEVIALTAPAGEVWHRCIALTHLGLTRWRQGERRSAAELLTQCLELRRLVDDPLGTSWCLMVLAWIAVDHDLPHAAVLFGAVRGLSDSVGAPHPHPSMAVENDKWERHTRDSLGAAAFDAAYRQGRGMNASAAIRYALQPEPGASASPDDPARIVLTAREREVAALIATGMTNKEIAAQLVISRRTAESHVEHILTKLGFSSRSQVAAWAAAQPDGAR